MAPVISLLLCFVDIAGDDDDDDNDEDNDDDYDEKGRVELTFGQRSIVVKR